MRSRLLPRVLAGLLVAGSLAACIPGGGEGPLPALLSAGPNPVVLDLPSSEPITKTITVRNLGPGVIQELHVHTSIIFESAPTPNLSVITDDCFEANLEPNDTCQIVVTASGSPPSGAYEITLRFSSDESNTVTVPVLLV